jgi:hypothetical protein
LQSTKIRTSSPKIGDGAADCWAQVIAVSYESAHSPRSTATHQSVSRAISQEQKKLVTDRHTG